MRTLVFSDTHLGAKFNQKLFTELVKLIESVDKVIINGDFWDYHLVSWDQFLNSEWSRLFPLLKSKNAVYTFGNHDPARLMDERMNLFSDLQVSSYELRSGEHTFVFQHGNSIAPTLDETMPIVLRSKRLVDLSYKVYDYFARRLGMSFFKLGKSKNSKMKKWAAKNLKSDQILVCGHSHVMESNLEKRFINTGLIRFGFMQYMIIEDGNFSLESYRL